MELNSGSKRGLSRSALLLGTAALVFPVAAMAQTEVQDIVVTAQKREQNLQDVPISITAISKETLQANRIQDVRDLSSFSPNLTVRTVGGGSQIPSYSMRGLVTFGTAAGTDKGVSVYLDGVYIQNVAGSVFEIADVERIEVLKGPQGTLFGRNSTGGAISYITRDPAGEFHVKQDLTYGNLDQFRSKTRVDLPQFGPFSVALTYLHSERRGDIRNLGAGTVWDYGPATGGAYGKRTSPEWLGSDKVDAAAAAVKIDLHPDLDIIYKFDFSQNHYTPNGVGISYLPSPQYQALYNSIPAAQRTPITSQRPDAVNNWFTTPGFQRSFGHNLTMKYQLNDQISLKNILAYRSSKITTTFQLDGLGGATNFGGLPNPIFGFGIPGYGTATINFAQLLALGQVFGGPIGTNPAAFAPATTGAPFTFLGNNSQTFETQWSNEFQVNIKTDGFNLTAGYLHFEDRFAGGGIEGTFNTSINTVHTGQNTSAAGTPFVIPGNPGYLHSYVRSISDAWFIQPEIHLTDRLDLIGGARITQDRKLGTEPLPDFRVSGAGARSPIRYRGSQPSYLVGLTFRPTDDLLTYAKFSTGYISGGTVATLQFLPETAKSWEAGIKADLFARRLRSNLAVFHVDYKNIQQATSGRLTGVPATAAFSQAVINTGDAEAYGFEWENTIIPFRGLTLTGNLGYTHFEYDKSSVPATQQALYGQPGVLAFNRPEWTGSVAAQYDTPELIAGGHLMFRIDGNYRSSIITVSNFSTNAASNSLNINAPADPGLVAVGTTKAIWLANGRVALTALQVAGAKAEIAVWGKNLFDDRSVYYSGGLGVVNPVGYERARTFGVDVSFEF